MPRQVSKSKRLALAKLTSPRLFNVVARERLFVLLDSYQWHPVIWIAAQPGAGKTTLAANYIQARRRSHIWYQCDAGDNDPATFFHFLREAADPRKKTKKEASLPLLTPEYLHDLPGFARRFFRALFARFERGAVLVLDNFQELKLEGHIATVLNAGFEEVPAGVNILVVSRESPGATFSRLLANQRVKLIDADQVKFDFEECKAFVASRTTADETTLRAFHAQCDGWAAGMTLALEHARRTESLGNPGRTSLQNVFDYFAGLLFDHASPRVQRTLIACAFPPFVTAQLAQQLSDDSESGKLLEQLYRRHLFVQRRDEDGETYHLHALFRAFLIAKASEMLQLAELSTLRRNTGRFLAQHGFPREAAELFREEDAWEELASLVSEHAEVLIPQGRGALVRDWIAAFPAQELSARPWLHYWLAEAWLGVDNRKAQSCAESADRGFSATDDELARLRTAVVAIEACWLEWDKFDSIAIWLPRLERDLAGLAQQLPITLQARTYFALLLSIINRYIDHPQAGQAIALLMRMLESNLPDSEKLRIGSLLMGTNTYCPSFALGEFVLQHVEHLGMNEAIRPIYRIMWFNRSCYHLCVMGRYSKALEFLGMAGDLASREGFSQYTGVQCLAAVMADLACRNRTSARQRLARTAPTIEGAQPLERMAFAFACFQCEYDEENLAAATAHAELALATAREANAVAFETYALMVLAQTHMERGNFETAEDYLRRTERWTARGIMQPLRLEVDLLRIYASLLRDQSSCSVASQLALALAEARGRPYAYPICNGLRKWSRVLEAALRLGIEPEYAVSEIRRLAIPAPSLLDAQWPWPVKIYTLGRFVVEINGKPLAFSGKAPRKLLGLLKVIIAHGCRDVPASRIIDELWPDEEADRAELAFRTAVKRLRELIGMPEIIRVNERKVSLDLNLVWVDALAFETPASSTGERDDPDRYTDRLIALYQGSFLARDDDAMWAVSYRERLRGRFLRLVEESGDQLERVGALERALVQYRAGIAADDLAEPLYRGEIRCLLALGRVAEAKNTFRKLKQILSIKLGIGPSERTLTLLQGV